ncbi:MAG: Ribonuclease HIII [uncultured Rubrobacteraceae bacterium]|uniref:Ribonuclease n=1 Tax=uncultured Rubrobacteraceae bacterium TaxID=349277 RepID=A0A6J4QYH4_9ACTN|nr:MAG: Ribonuclease HIII [uncultured Rubrobacteraceae bacterium]
MNEAPKNGVPGDLESLLDDSGAEVSFVRPIDYGTQYRVTRGSDTVPLNVYRTGKVSTGGKSSVLKTLIEDWRLARGGAARGRAGGVRTGDRPALDGTPRLGIDESGKGDYFGPLVVAGVRVLDREAARKLQEIGVRDSKDLSTSQAKLMAESIERELGSGNVRVFSLPPREYEKRRSAAGNVNKLLGEVDAGIISELKGEVEVVVVDEYAGAARSYLEPFVPEGVRLEVRTRAEDDAAVAAASILARGRQLEEMDRLSGLVGFELPRGATHVIGAGRRVHAERGMEGLKDVAKVSFATTKRIVG